MERRTYHFSGHVQGVGFRYTTHNIAQRHNVYGYVRNLPDGRVELVMEGPESEMDALANDVASRMERFIKRVDLEESPPTNQFTGFSIRH